MPAGMRFLGLMARSSGVPVGSLRIYNKSFGAGTSSSVNPVRSASVAIRALYEVGTEPRAPFSYHTPAVRSWRVMLSPALVKSKSSPFNKQKFGGVWIT